MTTTATADISVQNTDHPDKVVYHTKFELVSENVTAIRGDSANVGGLPEIILAVRGVTKVAAYPYMLAITRAPMFDWNDIRPSIEEILVMFASSQKQLEGAVNGLGSKPAEVAQSKTGQVQASPRTSRKS
jgi:Scaffold protein Nfu/NifU N terminal